MEYIILRQKKYIQQYKKFGRLVSRKGYTWAEEEKGYIKHVRNVDEAIREFQKTRHLRKKYHLRAKYISPFTRRSGDYRTKFLKNHHPDKNGKYRCEYCGRKVRYITVDHVVPVAMAQKNPKLVKKLMQNWTSINDEKNLVASCDHCNKSKGTKRYRIAKGRWKVKVWLVVTFTATVSAGCIVLLS